MKHEKEIFLLQWIIVLQTFDLIIIIITIIQPIIVLNRKFVQDKVNTDNDCIDHCRHDAEMYLTNASIHLLDDLDSEDNKTFTISSSNDSGMITMDPIRFNQNHSNHNHM